jgi:quercetin dioxygenase-like cupin family protein
MFAVLVAAIGTLCQPDRHLRAGDHFFNPRGVVHSLYAAPGTAGGVALSTWVVDKGKPLVEPVN